jgi:hypothetical protein
MQIKKTIPSDHKNIIALMNEMPDFFSLETVEYAQEMLDSLQ